MRRSAIVGLVVAAMLAMPAAAGAQGAACGDTLNIEVYGGVISVPNPCPPDDPPGGDLPFTGAETGLLGLAGFALLGVGVALRRLR